MLNLSCLFGTVLLCCMLSYNGVLPAHSAWRATAAGSPWGLAGASPRAGRPGQPPAAALPAAGASQPGRRAARPRWGHATAVKSVRMPCSNPPPFPAPFQRRSGDVPGPCRNGAGTPQAGLPGTILPEQLLEQLPERSRKRHDLVLPSKKNPWRGKGGCVVLGHGFFAGEDIKILRGMRFSPFSRFWRAEFQIWPAKRRFGRPKWPLGRPKRLLAGMFRPTPSPVVGVSSAGVGDS